MENLEIDAESNSKTHVYIFSPFSVYLAVQFSITVKITINVFFTKNKISAQKCTHFIVETDSIAHK